LEELRIDLYISGMKNFLKELIADPITGEELIEIKNNGSSFLSSGDNMYSITDDVPLLLAEKKTEITNSTLHTDFKSNFDYKQHYQQDASYFDYFKEHESAADKEEIRRLNQVIIHHVSEKAELILDVGCGNGWVAKYFLPKRKKVVSMDISVTNPAKVLKESPGENHAAIVADAYHLPFKKNTFDAIIASEIMEHVYDPKLFIANLMDVLKPGGRLIITTPYNEKIEYFLCVHCNKPTPKHAHLHSFSEKNIAEFIPKEYTDYKTEKFANKYLVRLRLDLLMSFLPFGLWKLKDSFVNSIFKKPMRFLIELNKK
jgi:2-polyprenyl-3-methyl-5-hydroxy-6-metoxy-1,4-benzoquinol methylase